MKNADFEEAASSPTRLLTWGDVAKRVPLSRTTIWDMRRRGEFPAPIRLSRGRIGWRESELDEWIAGREVR